MTDVVAHERPADAPSSPLTGRNVFITGGSGAFGRAFTQRCLDDGAKRVVVYSRSESRQAEMKAQLTDERLRYRIGDVRDEKRLIQAMRDADIVVHSAALKRVEVCEADPIEAVETNINGTVRVARAAIVVGAERALYLSTDKAAAPNTLYGGTKFVSERLWNSMDHSHAAGTQTRFACTRYGNVIASTGSVVPLWRAQAAAGERLSITDVRMDRFLMSMRQAVDLVVLALREMHGGEVFVPQIGAARMVDLAHAVAPGVSVDVVGIRPGEKIHETLITEDEQRVTTAHDGYFVIHPPHWPAPRGRGEQDSYRSDTARELTMDELRELVA